MDAFKIPVHLMMLTTISQTIKIFDYGISYVVFFFFFCSKKALG